MNTMLPFRLEIRAPARRSMLARVEAVAFITLVVCSGAAASLQATLEYDSGLALSFQGDYMFGHGRIYATILCLLSQLLVP